MDRRLVDKLILWLRRERPGTIVKLRDFWMQHLVRVLGIVPLTASLSVRVFRADGTIEDLGIVGTHAVSDAFVALLVDTLQSSEATFSDYKYHDSGTGNTGELSGDTGLETPCGEARDIGTQIEGATANIYKSVATHTYAGTFTIKEHGLFNTPGGAGLMDRSLVLPTIDMISGDRIEFTYQLTCTAGG